MYSKQINIVYICLTEQQYKNRYPHKYHGYASGTGMVFLFRSAVLLR
jgi:hypothetical protein